MMSGTSATKIPRWRSRYRNSIIQEVDGEQITTPQDMIIKIREAKLAHKQFMEVTFGRPQMSSMTSNGIPHLHVDQLNVIAHHLHTICTGDDQWQQKENIKCMGETTTHMLGHPSQWKPLKKQ
jgi:hypothetical protein